MAKRQIPLIALYGDFLPFDFGPIRIDIGAKRIRIEQPSGIRERKLYTESKTYLR